MPTDAATLKRLIETELACLPDMRVVQHIRSLLVEPKPIPRDWDYGKIGQQYVCWHVLENHSSNSAIVYCEDGFGPSYPWGIVFLKGEYASMGMDSGWSATFLEAYFEREASDIPIWRVFKTDSLGTRQPITEEGDWDQTWRDVMALREADPDARYDCNTSVIPIDR